MVSTDIPQKSEGLCWRRDHQSSREREKNPHTPVRQVTCHRKPVDSDLARTVPSHKSSENVVPTSRVHPTHSRAALQFPLRFLLWPSTLFFYVPPSSRENLENASERVHLSAGIRRSARTDSCNVGVRRRLGVEGVEEGGETFDELDPTSPVAIERQSTLHICVRPGRRQQRGLRAAVGTENPETLYTHSSMIAQDPCFTWK